MLNIKDSLGPSPNLSLLLPGTILFFPRNRMLPFDLYFPPDGTDTCHACPLLYEVTHHLFRQYIVAM